MTIFQLQGRRQSLTPPILLGEQLELEVAHLRVALVPVRDCAAAPQVLCGGGLLWSLRLLQGRERVDAGRHSR